MKTYLLLIFIHITYFVNAQPRYNAALLDTLEQIANTNTPSKHFAKMYYQAIEITNKHAATQPDSIKQFIFKFESAFGPLFFAAHKNYLTNESQTFSWQRYYANTSLNELQYQFIGMNAHINGDMWQALKNTFAYDTLKKYKHQLVKFQKAFDIFYDSIYVLTNKYKGVRFIHTISLGLDKWYGKKLVLKWRKRQVKLAMLWYSKPQAFKKKWLTVQKKMKGLDRFAIKHLK